MPTIFVSLDSFAPGTEPTVTNSVTVNESGQVTFNITWPSDQVNNGTCALQFINGTQDPFNDQTNGVTSFNFSRANSNTPAIVNLNVESDATIGTDTYCLTLTIDGQSFSTDPMIVIKPT